MKKQNGKVSRNPPTLHPQLPLALRCLGSVCFSHRRRATTEVTNKPPTTPKTVAALSCGASQAVHRDVELITEEAAVGNCSRPCRASHHAENERQANKQHQDGGRVQHGAQGGLPLSVSIFAANSSLNAGWVEGWDPLLGKNLSARRTWPAQTSCSCGHCAFCIFGPWYELTVLDTYTCTGAGHLTHTHSCRLPCDPHDSNK